MSQRPIIGGCLVVALALLGSAPLHADSAPEKKTLTLKFDAPSDVRKFTPFSGRWAVERGEYGTEYRSRAARLAATVFGRRFENLIASTRIVEAPRGEYSGVLLRGDADGKGRVSGYFIGFLNDGADSALEGFRLTRYDAKTGDGRIEMLCSKKLKTGKQRPHTIDVRSIGPKVTAVLDGDTTCHFSDKTYAEGFFGLAAFGKKGDAFAVDRLELTFGK